MSAEQDDLTKRLEHVYATESSALDPEWRTVVAALLGDEAKPGTMTLEEYTELYNVTLDAGAYRREFPADAPFTHLPTN